MKKTVLFIETLNLIKTYFCLYILIYLQRALNFIFFKNIHIINKKFEEIISQYSKTILGGLTPSSHQKNRRKKYFTQSVKNTDKSTFTN